MVQEQLVLQAQQVLLGSREAPEALVLPEALEAWALQVVKVLQEAQARQDQQDKAAQLEVLAGQVVKVSPVQLVLLGVLVELDRREERAELVAQEGLELTE